VYLTTSVNMTDGLSCNFAAIFGGKKTE